jgi:N-acetyl-gamma-glutamylphosphate reductase
MSIRVGIVGISGFGGGEAMRLVASHPSFELIYAVGEGSAGSRLCRCPWIVRLEGQDFRHLACSWFMRLIPG